MQKDYAKINKRKKHPSKTTHQKKHPTVSFGKWWIIIGIFVVFFLGILGYLKQRTPLSYRHFSTNVLEQSSQNQNKPSRMVAKNNLPPRHAQFEFYDMSPSPRSHINRNIIATNPMSSSKTLSNSAVGSLAQPAPSSISAPLTSKIESEKSSTSPSTLSVLPNSRQPLRASASQASTLSAPEVSNHFSLQVASFRNFQEADKLKAQLTLLGFKAQTLEVMISGVQWVRVQVGPFNHEKTAKQAQILLRQHHYSSVLVTPPRKVTKV